MSACTSFALVVFVALDLQATCARGRGESAFGSRPASRTGVVSMRSGDANGRRAIGPSRACLALATHRWLNSAGCAARRTLSYLGALARGSATITDPLSHSCTAHGGSTGVDRRARSRVAAGSAIAVLEVFGTVKHGL